MELKKKKTTDQSESREYLRQIPASHIFFIFYLDEFTNNLPQTQQKLWLPIFQRIVAYFSAAMECVHLYVDPSSIRQDPYVMMTTSSDYKD